MEDLTSILPNGQNFDFWECKTDFKRELHVNQNDSNALDSNDGSAEAPFRTINAAAQAATVGDRILVHGGTYRETIKPARGGESADKMISYETFGDDEVFVKASVVATDFVKSEGWILSIGRWGAPAPDSVKVWATELNPEDFKGYNPFCAVNVLHDRAFLGFEGTDPTPYLNRRGMVFVDNVPMRQVQLYCDLTANDNTYWVDTNGQTVHFRLKNDDDPKNHLIELTCREQCFVPAQFLSYIRVKGFTFAHASMGAPVPQRGAISCSRGHHFIIEDCVVDWSNAVGIDTGNECWTRPTLEGKIHGYNVIRRTTIKDAGVCGIAGMIAENTLIEDCLFANTGWQGMEGAWESGGIKLHHSKHSLIRRNIFRDCYRCDGIWLDYGNKNDRITGNLFLNGNHNREHIYLECNRDSHIMIDNNILWGAEGWCGWDMPGRGEMDGWHDTHDTSKRDGYGIYLEGTDETYIFNNLIGNCNAAGFFGRPVARRMSEGRGGSNRDARVFNNIFHDCGDAAIKFDTPFNSSDFNVFSKMSQGYLCVVHPEPIHCLDLPAWRKYFGFDINGEVRNLDIKIDSENLTMEITVDEDFVVKPANEHVSGRFSELKKGKTMISIDPRNL